MESSSKGLYVLIACLVCLTIAVTTALPISLGDYNGEAANSNYLDTCTLCIAFSDSDACELCNYDLADSPLAEKRSGRFHHPLLRGSYLKKSSYYPFYNPLIRGSYLKKSYNPTHSVYHPFLRGGYRGPTLPQRNYWSTDEVEEP